MQAMIHSVALKAPFIFHFHETLMIFELLLLLLLLIESDC